MRRDRGRGADVNIKPKDFGAAEVATRIEGAELLEDAIKAGKARMGEELSSEEEVDSSDEEGGVDVADSEGEEEDDE